ncbi:hypothetical protein [Nodularia sphaerocarpa]|uniref:hypothetical protein n=1 Tax=Nodularia sphaerocarpa TaxID=137816 RepID=UPI001EFB1EF2|nr:hypothetical protein [Nodularia sphaerocarpa]MDB9373051.1 hypothetical protein [Nodularia sphaerocarpa CS-585]MDB9380318.1 hypothetical protein [Nodularia sphaerocarpa CS-585A2]ULP74485.1 hypothetical protein BDGGKGIB_04154 [Nodularia sphaerocarpa UHCC 0038]
MSYVSLLKNIPDILSQPTGIAAIASLGIHGAIALIVPLMPVDSDSSQVTASQKSVGILELSQADQNRLPETPTTSFPSQLALQPQLPQQPQLLPPNLDIQRSVLPPLPAPMYRQSALPPNITANYRIPPNVSSNRNVSFPQRQPTPATGTAPVAPREEIRFDTSGFNAANQRFTSSTPSFNQNEVRVATQALPVERLPKLTASKIPGDLPNTPPTTRATNTTPQSTRPNGNQELIARLQQTPQAQDELFLANQTLPKFKPASTPKTPDLPLKTVNEQQGLIAQLNSYEGLRKQIQQAYPNSQEKPVIRETVAVNKPNVQGTVLGFLVVDPEGKVLDIKFQDQSVSQDLQLKAREYFNTRSPKGGQQISSYPFNLSFQNNGNATGVTPEQTPAASLKPLPELRIQNQQPSAPATVIIPQPSTTPEANNNSLSSTLESGQKLIQQLRQVREERQDSSPK